MEASNLSWRGRQPNSMMTTPRNGDDWYGRPYRAPQGFEPTSGRKDCGMYFGYQHKCRAAAQCFFCKGFGHFSKDCSSRRSVNSTTQQERKASKRKSEKKRNRDRARALHFYDRKSICVDMPLYELSESELHAFFPKTGCFDNSQHAKLKRHFHKATQENTAKKSLIANLQACLEEEQSRLRKTEREVCFETTKTEIVTRELENQKWMYECLQLTKQDLMNEIDQLQDRVDFYQNTVQALQQDVEQKETLIEVETNKRRDLEVKLKSVETSYRNSVEQLETEKSETKGLKNLLSQCRCLRMARRPTPPLPAEKCTRCGLKDGHYPHNMVDCPAFDELCNFCGQLGHFASECRSKKRATKTNPVAKKKYAKCLSYHSR